MKESTLKIVSGIALACAGLVTTGLGVIELWEGMEDKAFEDVVEAGDVEITNF